MTDIAPPPEVPPVRAHAGPDASALELRLVARFPSLAPALRGLDGSAALIMVTAAVLLLVFRKFGGSTYFESVLRPDSLAGHRFLTVYGDYYWFLSCFFVLGLIPLLVLLPRSVRPPSLGLGLGDWRFGIKWCGILFGIMAPIVFVASRSDTFSSYYPLNEVMGRGAVAFFGAKGSAPDGFLVHFVAYELLYGLYFVGWEYFFRGFLTFGLYERLGINGVFIGNIPFALMHLGKPFPEAMGSVVAGIALGVFALRARSFWYAWILHAGIAWTMDAAALQQRIGSGAS